MSSRSLLLTLTFLCCSPAAYSQSKPAQPIVVIAHRGVHETLPENTLASIRKAIELGCDYVEIDVRSTKDGELILMHDRSVARTTNGTGWVAKLTFAEIRGLQIDEPGKATQEAGKVPTFAEALKLCRGKIKVLVDNKSGPPADVIAAIKRHKMLDDVIIYGSIEQLKEFKKLAPNVWIMPGHPGSPEKIKALVGDLKPETLDGHIGSWTAPQVLAAHEVGAEVWVDVMGKYDNQIGFQKGIELGVDAIQTDHPAALLAYLKRIEAAESVLK